MDIRVSIGGHIMDRRFVYAAICTALFNFTPHESHAEEHIARIVGDFDEQYSNEVPVSGNVIAGVMLATVGRSKSFDPHILKHTLSSSAPADLCLSMVSQDGTYHSRNTYQTPNVSDTTLIAVDYSKTHYSDFLQQNAGQHIAMKAQPGNCASTDADTYLATAISNNLVEQRSLILQIDSLGATEVKSAARGKDRTIIQGVCKSISGERKTGYDFTCTIPLDALSNETIDVQIQRRRFGRMMQALRIKVEI